MAPPSTAQSAADTAATAARSDTVYSISEVVVTAARRPGSMFQTPLALTVLGPRDIRTGRAFGIDEALAAVPGVLAQSRSGNQDVRIAIRGFGARGAGQRSNAGTTRGIRILVDGIPETEPDGRTSLDLVDLSLVERIEVLRSNATSLWGNGSGGVILIGTVPGPETPRTFFQASGGGFGFRKITGRLWDGTEAERLYIGLSHTAMDGWRDHSRSSRTLLNAGIETSVWHTTRLGLYLAAGLSAFRIPGPLTPAQFQADPFQAQNDPAAYSPTFVERDERRFNRLGRFGVVLTHPMGPSSELSATFFVTPKYLQRSERNTYREFTRYHVGGSLSHAATLQLSPSTRLILRSGVDGALQDGVVLFYQLAGGGRGPLETDKREGATTGGLFTNGELYAGDRLCLLAGIRFDAVRYVAEDYYEADPSTRLLADFRNFSRWTPTAGLSYLLSPTHSIYVTVGGGLEVPGANETSPPSTAGEDTVYALNPLIDASRSTTVEVGTRQVVTLNDVPLLRLFSYDIAAYRIDVRNDFVPYRGGRFYFSAGRTERLGIEAGMTAEIAGDVTLAGAVTLSHNRYVDYMVDSVHYGRPGRSADYGGNRMAGVPDFYYHAAVRWGPGGAIAPYGEIRLQGSGRYYADDANLFSVPPFTVWNLRAGVAVRPPEGGGMMLDLSLTLENAANRAYAASAWINPDRNARGEPVYLEPGSPRLLFVQLSAGWQL